MISKELIRETLAQTDQTLLAYRELIPDQAHYFLFPFTLQGCINVTETVSSLKHSALMMTLFFYEAFPGHSEGADSREQASPRTSKARGELKLIIPSKVRTRKRIRTERLTMMTDIYKLRVIASNLNLFELGGNC